MIFPQPEMYKDWKQWGAQITQTLTGLFTNPEARPLNAYVIARLPSAAASKWQMVIVLDETDGEIPAWSDGTNWRRVTDRAVVS